ncbi:PLP-dependent aminotransferase family protein [uncultured Thiothrix sp.]|uniref:aminotransferase-like domain-containing protein n=1 Tax=uncultured Thiothrix sp. TaxID=223185 RepID=UPI00260698D5|nr:PLP-dependent aminotransferase family protein [uncultured Thiothrix sp.]HMT92521.1 PLP-dependent aminotransferase family protein [Thiolinea sp.]
MPLKLAQLSLDRDQTIPLSRQLYVQLHQQVIHGEVVYGERLPASRELAESLKLSRGVIVEAYEMLRIDGLVAGFGKGGTQVCYQQVPPMLVKTSKRILSLSTRGKTITQARQYTQAPALPLTPGLPDLSLFPHQQWLSLSREAWQQTQGVYQRAGGLKALKLSLRNFLAQYRGIQVDDLSCLLITTGSQGALSLLASLLTETGDIGVVEQPGWAGAEGALRQAGLNLHYTRLDAEGALVPQDTKAKLAVLTPNAQYPTGSVMSMQRREAWLQYSQHQHTWLIEDDYAAEYSYQQYPTPSLLTHPHAEQVIHIGTMSKLMLPDLRLGWIVLPKAIAKEVCAALNTLGLQPAYSIQQQLALFIQYGYLGQHLARTRAIYNERRKFSTDHLQEHANGLFKIVPSQSGMNLILELIPEVDVAGLSRALKSAALGCAVYVESNPVNTSSRTKLVLGHACLLGYELEVCVNKLLQVLKLSTRT